jgi:hypothetical protein
MHTFYYIIFIILFMTLCSKILGINTNEPFDTYYRAPYNNIDTGTNPLVFYEYPTYREPYEYPYTFYKSYPVPHLSNWDDII